MTRFNLHILHLLILLHLHQFVGLPQHLHPDQIPPNRRWLIAPQSHFWLSIFFDILALRVVLQYKFFHYVEHHRRSHNLYWIFSPPFGIKTSCASHPLLSLLVDLLSLLVTSIIWKVSAKSGDAPWNVTHHIICCQCFLQRNGYGDGKRIVDIDILRLYLETFCYPWLTNWAVHMEPTRSTSHFESKCSGW